MFDAKTVKDQCVRWIQEFFRQNGPDCNAIVGISGGKDSSVVAALCVEALGKDRVIGVLMPCGQQHDIDMAQLLVEHLGIRHYVINIHDAVEAAKAAMPFELSAQSKTNLPPESAWQPFMPLPRATTGGWPIPAISLRIGWATPPATVMPPVISVPVLT